MTRALFWDEDGEHVYGLVSDFLNREDFIESVKNEYEDYKDGKCEVVDIKVQPCLSTEDTIYGECIMPLSSACVSIEDYYTARVQPLNA